MVSADTAVRRLAGSPPRVAFLLGRRRSILADDMGLGKTRQSVVAMTQAAPAGPWLVVCPASVKYNWEREIGLAIDGAATHVVGAARAPPADYTGWVIVNYGPLKRGSGRFSGHPSGFVFDEAHYLKNHRARRSGAGAPPARRRRARGRCPEPGALLTGSHDEPAPRLFPRCQLLCGTARAQLLPSPSGIATHRND